MGVLVVGGAAKGVGKTTLVCALIARLRARRWTAVKITQCHHESSDCHCQLRGGRFAMDEESDREGLGDTARYLRAGAERAVWMRAAPDGMAEAMAALREYLYFKGNVVIESNRVLEFVTPDVCIFVAGCGEMKASADAHMGKADLVVKGVEDTEAAIALVCLRLASWDCNT